MANASENVTMYALLGVLCLRPMSGYDLKQMIAESIGHFWRESYGQIYPALRRLAERGLVEKRVERNAGKPDRHVYRITERGHEALTEWLRVTPRVQPVRDELLLKLFFGGEADAAMSREHVLTFLAAQEQEARTYEQIATYLSTTHADNPRMPYWRITLRRGIHDSQAAIAWARETLDTLEELARTKLSVRAVQHETHPNRTTEETHA